MVGLGVLGMNMYRVLGLFLMGLWVENFIIFILLVLLGMRIMCVKIFLLFLVEKVICF